MPLLLMSGVVIMFMFDNAKDVLSYVDGHVDYAKIYWNSNAVTHIMSVSFPLWPACYDPPDGYGYKWSGD